MRDLSNLLRVYYPLPHPPAISHDLFFLFMPAHKTRAYILRPHDIGFKKHIKLEKAVWRFLYLLVSENRNQIFLDLFYEPIGDN